MAHAFYESPIGWMKITAKGKQIESLDFLDKEGVEPTKKLTPVLKKCIQELNEFFQKKRTAFTIPIVEHGSDFQRQVMREVSGIEFGHVATYLDIANRVGDPNTVRAVGGANGRNCIPIIIPCHRIVAADGKLTGYAWGLWRKKWLLEFERGQKQLDLF